MNEDNFFPEDYKVPKTSTGFMKFLKGDNLFRFLARPVMGFEYWTEDDKPVRSKNAFDSLPENAKKDKDGNVLKAKHIWIAPVYNYDEGEVAILTITQKGVQEAILGLTHDKDWGNPMHYDIKVNREGDGFDTKYKVNPKPKKDLDPAIAEVWEGNKESIVKSIEEMFNA